MTSCYEEGPQDAEIVLVGEAPSNWEVRDNAPFRGPAGQLLDLCLNSAGILRSKVYITNCFEDMIKKPKENQGIIMSRAGEVLWTDTKGFTEAGKAASAGCLERLRKTTANVIVPMGAPALSLCLDSRRIGKWHGSIVESGPQLARQKTLYGHAEISRLNLRKLVPTIHPASCLHGSYASRFLIISDLRKAKRQSAFPEIRPLTRKLIIDPGFEEACTFLRRCLSAPLVNTDIELLNGQVDCFSLACDTTEAMSIPLLDAGFEHRWSEEEERIIWELYARIVSHPEITKVNQNITFDLATLLQTNRIVPQGPVQDPMVAHSVMYPFLEKKLGVLCSLYTDEPYYKDDGELSDSPTVADFARRWTYNAKDSLVSLQSWEFLAPLIDPQGYRPTYELTMNMVGSLIYMMVRGMKLDEKALLVERDRVRAKIEEKVKALEIALARPIITAAPKTAGQKKAALANGSININSPKQLANYFYLEKAIRPYKNAAGKESVDDTALTRIFRRHDLAEAKLLQEYRALEKLCGTYLEVKYDEDRRLRCSYNIRGTWTGRLSSSQTVYGTGLNKQNLSDDFVSFLTSDMKTLHAL